MQDVSGTQVRQLGQAFGQVGAAAFRVGEVLQDRVDTARTKEADALLADAYRQTLRSPEGYLTKAGRGAIDGRKDVLQALEDQRRKIEDSLDNDVQREMFGQQAERRFQSAIGDVDEHYVGQTRAYELAGAEARANAFLNDAVDKHWSDPDGAKDAHRGMLLELDAIADNRGVDPDVRKEMHLRATTQMWGNVLDQMLEAGDAAGAKELLEEHGDEISVDKRTSYQGRVKKVGIDQQGYAIADQVINEGGPVLEQLEKVRAGYEGGGYDLAVMESALQQIKVRADEDRIQKATVGSELLSETQKWSQLNRGAPLSEAQWDELDKAGVKDDMELFLLQGEQWITTGRGYEVLDNISDSELLDARSFDVLRDKYRMELSEKGMTTLRTKWDQAQDAANRGTGGGGSGGKTMTTTGAVKQFLTGRVSWYDPARGETWNKTNAWRREQIELELERFEASLNRKFSGQQEMDEALRQIWNNGAVIDGQWLPVAAMTHAERVQATSYMTPQQSAGLGGATQGPPRSESYRPIVPSDFDAGGRFSEHRDPATGLPVWSALDAMDTDPTTASDGIVALRPGQQGAIEMVRRDPLTGEAIPGTEINATVPSFEEAQALLVGYGIEPTLGNVQAFRAEALGRLNKQTAQADQIMPREMSLRQDKFLSGLNREYEQTVLAEVSRLAKMNQSDDDKIAKLKEQGATVKRQSPAVGPDYWAVKMPDGVSLTVPVVDTPVDMDMVKRAAIRQVIAKNRSALEAYGIAGKYDSFFSGTFEDELVGAGFDAYLKGRKAKAKIRSMAESEVDITSNLRRK